MAEFDTKVKKACWEKQMHFLGRNPRRWRLDVDGKPVMKELEGADGICGFHFDHIVPKSAAKMLPEKEQKKLDEVTKCQVICSSSFRRKIKSDPDPIKDVLCDIDLNEAEMDLVEMAEHGSLTDDLGKKKCKCVSKVDIKGGVHSRNVLPCEHPITGRNLCQELRERFLTMQKD